MLVIVWKIKVMHMIREVRSITTEEKSHIGRGEGYMSHCMGTNFSKECRLNKDRIVFVSLSIFKLSLLVKGSFWVFELYLN